MEIRAFKDFPLGDSVPIMPPERVSGTYTCSRCEVTYTLAIAEPETVADIGDPPPPHFERLYEAIDAEHDDHHPTLRMICRDDEAVLKDRKPPFSR